jgi:hypothetical protein
LEQVEAQPVKKETETISPNNTVMFFIEKTPFFLIKSDDKPRNYTWFHGQYKEVCPVKDLPLTYLFI